MNADTGACPQCGGDPVVSVEVRGVYDGTLVFQCGSGHRWPRFPSGRLHAAGLEWIAVTRPVDLSGGVW